MGWLEEKLLKAWTGLMPYLWRRYIDDILFFWRHSEEDLVSFLTFLNASHQTIKFTAEWRTNGQIKTASWDSNSKSLIVTTKPQLDGMKNNSIDYLDTTIWIDNEGMIQTDLFVKDCAKITYLLPSSCHPGHVTRNIPYSLAYRLKRIVSIPETFEMRLNQLKQNLLDRKYNRKVIEDAFNRVIAVKREDALKKVIKNAKSDKRPVFVVTFDPRLPDIGKIMTAAYNSSSKDHKFKKTFPEKPMIAYRRQKNIGEFITKAKLHPNPRDGAMTTREVKPGFQKCRRFGGSGCSMCPYVENASSHYSSATNEYFPIQSFITCTSKNMIYGAKSVGTHPQQ